jgi:hypothetical protein
VAVDQLSTAGWRIEDVREEHPPAWFRDIAALIGYVRSLPWAFEEIDWQLLAPGPQQLHTRCLTGPLLASQYRFLILAEKV